MHKLIAWSCIVGLIAASTYSFAAVKVVRYVNGRKIIQTIDQDLAWARWRARHAPQTVAVKPRKVASVPSGYYRVRVATRNMGQLLKGELHYARSNAGKVAAQATPARQAPSFTQYVERAVAKSQAERLHRNPVTLAKNVSAKELATAWKETGGKMLYDDQIKLVRDVVDFYEKQGQAGQRVVGPNGLELVRYDLPSERMVIYRPGRDEIQMLNADQYCIIYDPADKYGQIISVGALEMFAPVK